MIKSEEYPIFNQKINDEDYLYLDNAATVPMAMSVQKKLSEFMNTDYANVHRGVYTTSQRATEQYEAVRDSVKHFLNASQDQDIIFTSGTTQSINLVAQSFGDVFIQEGDDILVSVLEHHANLVPWQQLAKRKKANLVYMPVTKDGQIDIEKVSALLHQRSKILAVTHVSNVLGVINDVDALADMIHQHGGVIVIDGAQSVSHLAINVSQYDFFAFSGHKTGALNGVGVLSGKQKWLAMMSPMQFGGDMIEKVGLYESTFQKSPHKFEAGTPNIVGVISLKLAIDFLKGISFRREHDIELCQYLMRKLQALPYISVYGTMAVQHKVATVAFNVGNIHPHDIATALDMEGIAVRAGHHCAQPLHGFLQVPATVRASFYVYHTRADVDRFVEALEKVWVYFNGVE